MQAQLIHSHTYKKTALHICKTGDERKRQKFIGEKIKSLNFLSGVAACCLHHASFSLGLLFSPEDWLTVSGLQ
jgi:hypothetical protein